MKLGIKTHPPSKRYEIVKACIASQFVSLSAMAAGGSVTQQFPCVTTFPLSAGKLSGSIITLQEKEMSSHDTAKEKKNISMQRNGHTHACCRKPRMLHTGVLTCQVALSNPSAGLVYINTSGKYNFTCCCIHIHLQMTSFPSTKKINKA